MHVLLKCMLCCVLFNLFSNEKEKWRKKEEIEGGKEGKRKEEKEEDKERNQGKEGRRREGKEYYRDLRWVERYRKGNRDQNRDNFLTISLMYVCKIDSVQNINGLGKYLF